MKWFSNLYTDIFSSINDMLATTVHTFIIHKACIICLYLSSWRFYVLVHLSSASNRNFSPPNKYFGRYFLSTICYVAFLDLNIKSLPNLVVKLMKLYKMSSTFLFIGLTKIYFGCDVPVFRYGILIMCFRMAQYQTNGENRKSISLAKYVMLNSIFEWAMLLNLRPKMSLQNTSRPYMAHLDEHHNWNFLADCHW